MFKRLKNIMQGSFVRNVFIMASGTAMAQVISMLLAPIITRIYGPEAYGMMGTFMAIISIFTPIAALTYPIAIVLPKSNEDAKGLVRLSLLITIGVTVLSFLIIISFYDYIVNLFQLEEVASFLLLIPLAILFGGFLQVVEQWLIRTKQFGVSAQTAVTQSILVNGGKAGVGFFYPKAAVLIFLTAIAEGVRAFLMLFFSRKGENQLSLNIFKKSVSLKKLASEHKDFPLFRAPQVFLNAASQSLPVLMLTSLFGPAAAGFYSIGRTVLSVPSTLIGKSVGDVFYPRISEAANHGENLTDLIKKATLSLAAVGAVPYALVVLFGPWLFSLVFGQEWYTAGEYARWVALWIFFMFINQPSVRALPVLRAQSFHLIFTICTLIIRIAALFFGYSLFKSDVVAIALFGITGAILNLLLILITLRLSRKFDKERGQIAIG
ncbi:lipopolysaccharide biosynthesis protein [Pallidibacillus thermolactis]|jgi:O-antigen/teichoic acid export membrane protein|uniref:lipopolysaccharide biosynthesis protein n=1 Tax=Pallidibacillus thermolactis TaxID=251051 RepID=UPI002E1A6816|nr:oligosaccharide flippase family protein [Pallidibacillus thermolactis subsp. kokeshiiformis]